ncbi:hypothetical protein GTZ93_16215 [Corallococcus exiguus]|uniref:Transposase n=1 Tax=Corallococcus exiguus TaxID=83462 RepID=A0A7X4Y9G8_9BACT|nr:hypothetical protein [Corallococcus exiguus]TNV66983.1 hypothetical protein FH620_03390 [Corallococcus exiguus]
MPKSRPPYPPEFRERVVELLKAGRSGKSLAREFGCTEQSPRQRGTNENTNRLLRQYFPDGTDLSSYSQAQLNAIAARLNRCPRKTLDFLSPAEKLESVLL